MKCGLIRPHYQRCFLMLVMFHFFPGNNIISAQNHSPDTTIPEKNMDEVFIKSKVDLMKLLFRFTNTNFTEKLPDSLFRYDFRFAISTEINDSIETKDSASGCFYIDSKRGKYKYLSSLHFGEMEKSNLSTSRNIKWGFSLPSVFLNNPLDNEKSFALEGTEKGTYVKLSNERSSKTFRCYNKWKNKPGYEKLRYPYLSYIYYFDSLNRLDSATVFQLVPSPNNFFSDTSLFRSFITYYYAKDNPRIITKAICQISSVKDGEIVATQRLIVEAVPTTQPINFAMTKYDKPVPVFRNLLEACSQFDHLKQVSD